MEVIFENDLKIGFRIYFYVICVDCNWYRCIDLSIWEMCFKGF